jgi:mRNA-degrading endonuclease toxin of MazEF toxin-antitoxin module
MRSGSYCPDAGDFIWIDLNPTQGNEQRGRRLAIVLSLRARGPSTSPSLGPAYGEAREKLAALIGIE